MTDEQKQRVLFHADMDSFFASVEILSDSRLRGKPVIVGGRPESRSVVCSPSYEARKFGVKAGMPISEAKRLCPRGIFLPGSPKKYLWYSQRILCILIEFTPWVEPFSIDEAFLEFRQSWQEVEKIRQTGERIRDTIRRQLGLAVTIGIAPNKMLAKLVSDAAKPDGLQVLPPCKVDSYLTSLPVGKLWGVGERTQAHLHRLGMFTVNDLRRFSSSQLRQFFGAWGESLHAMAWGVDDSPIHPYYEEEESKSLGHEETFLRDLTDEKLLLAHLMELSEKVASRLRKKHYYTRLITVKRKYSDLTQQTRAQLLALPTQLDRDLFEAARKALNQFEKPRQPIRLLGITAGNLIKEKDLLEQNLMTALLEQELELTRTVDKMRAKYGPSVIHRARSGLVVG